MIFFSSHQSRIYSIYLCMLKCHTRELCDALTLYALYFIISKIYRRMSSDFQWNIDTYQSCPDPINTVYSSSTNWMNLSSNPPKNTSKCIMIYDNIRVLFHQNHSIELSYFLNQIIWRLMMMSLPLQALRRSNQKTFTKLNNFTINIMCYEVFFYFYLLLLLV